MASLRVRLCNAAADIKGYQYALFRAMWTTIDKGCKLHHGQIKSKILHICMPVVNFLNKGLTACVSLFNCGLSVASHLSLSTLSWLVRPLPFNVLNYRNQTTTLLDHRVFHWFLLHQQMELDWSGNSGNFSWTFLALVVQSRLSNNTPTKCTPGSLNIVAGQSKKTWIVLPLISKKVLCEH